MANELVARKGLRVSGSTFLQTVSTDQTLLNSVLAIDPSTREIKLLAAAGLNSQVFVSGGTVTGTGDKDLLFTNTTGGTFTVTNGNVFLTGGTYDDAAGQITFTNNSGGTFQVGGWDYFSAATISSNQITLTDNGGTNTTLQVDAITGLGYDNDWALSGTSTGVSAPAVELPFITGGSYVASADTLTLSINGGLESDITISGFEGSDTFVTGGTVVGETLTLGRNDGNDVVVTGFSFDITGDNTGGGTIEMGDTLTFIGGTGITVNTDGANPGSVTVILDDTAVSTGSYGAADTVATFTVDQQGRLTAASDVTIDITASQVSDFATSAETAIFTDANFVDSSNIDFTVTAGASVTADLIDTGVVAGNYGSDSQVAVFDVDAKGRITAVSGETINGANIDNNDIVISASTGSASASLDGTQFVFDSPDNSVTISGDGTNTISFVVTDSVDTKITGGTYTDNTGTLTLTDNDNTTITIDGKWNHFESASISQNVITFTSNTGETSTVTVAAVTGGTFDASTGIITVEGSGTFTNIDLGTDFVTGVTEANNVISVTKNGGAVVNSTIQAITGISYSSDWAVSFSGTGTLSTSPFELPFITGGTYAGNPGQTGTLTLGINGGLESDITITGFSGSDTFVTGATVEYSAATLTRNDDTEIKITSEQTIRVEATGAGTGSTVALFSVTPADYSAVHVEYTIVDGANARSGFFTAVFNGANVEYADWSTVDIGTVVGELSATSAGVVNYVGSGTIIANTRAIAVNA